MLQRLFRGQADAVTAIEMADQTMTDALDAAETERDGLQAQIDAIDRQIDALYSQRAELCRQKSALDDAIGDGYDDMAGGGMTVTVYPNGRGAGPARASTTEDTQALAKAFDNADADLAAIEDEIASAQDDLKTAQETLDSQQRLLPAAQAKVDQAYEAWINAMDELPDSAQFYDIYPASQYADEQGYEPYA